MTSNPTSNTHHLTSDAPSAAEPALAVTRAPVHNTLDHANTHVRELQSSLKPALEHLVENVQHTLRHGLDSVTESRKQAQKSLARGADATARYVAEQPVKSVLLAAATGAAVTALLIALTRRR